MLEWLRIKNLALVEDAEIEFTPGFNVISGETGAGKSVIVGAVSYLLGERADKTTTRHDADRCELSASIRLSGETAARIADFLKKWDLPPEDADAPERLLLRRVISRAGGRHFVNDTPVTLNVLRELGDLLVDFHGPHEHQSLLRADAQLALFDRFGGLGDDRATCAEAYRLARETDRELEALKSDLPDAVEAESLRHMVREIARVNPEPGEDAALAARHALAANARETLEIAFASKQGLYESEDSVSERLATIHRGLHTLSRFDPAKAEDFIARLDRLSEETRDLAMALEDYAASVELDERALAEIETRMSDINALKRRYGPAIEDVLATAEKAEKRLETLDRFAELKSDLENRAKERWERFQAIAAGIREKRRLAAKRFATAVKEKLRVLGLEKTELFVQMEETHPSPTGTDKLEIMFSANPGAEPAPLRKVASSGEMSRVTLAIKTVLSDVDDVPVLIFDEIDANIGGETANRVAAEMRSLGEKRQILCVSHLPQVASRGQSHFRVAKSGDDRVVSHIQLLSDKDRVKELARMLGGGAAAEKHAKDMLAGRGKRE